MTKSLKLIAGTLIGLIAGLLAGKLITGEWPAFLAKLIPSGAIYTVADDSVISKYEMAPSTRLGWKSLLPADQEEVLTRYQDGGSKGFSGQIYQSLEAAFDQSYIEAMQSTDIVEQILGSPISISGFVVPLEVLPSRKIESFFLVPYYGACIHFPPPPPNQMIYVRVEDGLESIDNTQPVTLKGWLGQAMYEDPLGTSAYSMELVEMRKFDEDSDNAHPDDVRNHEAD